jgi:hypothetical protein
MSSSRCVMSEATTSAPVRAAGSAALPVPADVEDVLAGADAGRLDQARSERGDQLRGDGVVVAEGPERGGVGRG